MKNRTLTLLALLVFIVAPAASALADSGVTGTATSTAANGANFVSGNPRNDGQFKPRKVIQRKENRQPGFWDREWKRSGLGETGDKMKKWNPFAGAGRFLKEKDEAYRAKHPESAAN